MAAGLEGAFVFVTGAATGIGRASALLLAQHSANVITTDRDDGDGAAVATEVARKCGKVCFLAQDVSWEWTGSRRSRKCAGVFGGSTRSSIMQARA